MYIHEYKEWPNFAWDQASVTALLADTRHVQGRLLGRMEALGFALREKATLESLTQFDDGNGRIARAISDMLVAKSEQSPQRFYSMSAQIQKERNVYYQILEKCQKGTLDITIWIEWFLGCLKRAVESSEETLEAILTKARFWKYHTGESFNKRQFSMLNRLLDGFKGKLTSSKWAKIEKCSQDTALRDINNLVSRGILKREHSGGRSTHYTLITTLEA